MVFRRGRGGVVRRCLVHLLTLAAVKPVGGRGGRASEESKEA